MIKLTDLLSEKIKPRQKISKKEWSKIKKFNKHIGQDGTHYVTQLDKKLGTILVPVVVEEKLTEVSAGVNVFYFYKKANKDKNKFFKMLSDFRKKHSDTKWMKMLNYALEDFNENPKKYKTIDDKQNKLFKNLQQNKKVYEEKLTEKVTGQYKVSPKVQMHWGMDKVVIISGNKRVVLNRKEMKSLMKGVKANKLTEEEGL